MNWIKKTWFRLLWHIKELNKTFSNEKSYYLSKRIERAILFINAVFIFDYYVFKNLSHLTYTEIMEAFAINLLYAGFLVKQNQVDKKHEAKSNNPTDVNNV